MLLTLTEKLRRLFGLRPTRSQVKRAHRKWRAWQNLPQTRDDFGDPPAPPMKSNGDLDWDRKCVNNDELAVYIWYECWYVWQNVEIVKVALMNELATYEGHKAAYTTCMGGTTV